MKSIRVSAVLMRNAEGRVLCVRKRGTSMLMLPGGKPEGGEQPAETAVREFQEELGVLLDADRFRLIGTFVAAAANEPDHVVEATVFEHPFTPGTVAAAEIDLVTWVDPAMPEPHHAPLNTEHIFPAILA